MSRRTLLAALLGAALSGPFPGSASAPAVADACFTFTDIAGDAVAEDDPSKQAKDASLDITGVTFTTADGDLVATLAMPGLTARAAHGNGDEIQVEFHVHGKRFMWFADRDASGLLTGDGLQVDGTTQSAALVTATHDTTAKTVTFRQPLDDVAKFAGQPMSGAVLRKFSARTYAIVGLLIEGYDEAVPAGNVAYQVGTPCGATPPLPAPALGKPSDGCTTYTDPSGDGKPNPTTNAATAGPDDQDLDIVAVTVRTTPTELLGYIRVTNLVEKPVGGHRFDFSFKHAGKTVVVNASQMDAAYSTAFVVGRNTTIGGQSTPGVIGSAWFDPANDQVVLGIDLADLAARTGEPAGRGTVVTDVFAKSYLRLANQAIPADTAPNVVSAESTARIGDNTCFPPPPSKLASIGVPASVQYGDRAAVSARLTDEAGAALAGRDVTFAVGADRVTASTNAAGVASASLATTRTAGTHPMTVTFAGDESARAVTASASLKVVAEATRIALSVAKSGSRRTVTAVLTDDDRTVLAGQTITWYVNGRKVATSRSDSRGRASYGGARPGQTVKAAYAGAAGRYGGSHAQVRA